MAAPAQPDERPDWTFLTNHGHVLICLAQDADLRIKDVAQRVGITERAVQSILGDLEAAGFLVRERDGRRNHYRVRLSGRFRHSIEKGVQVSELVRLFT